MIYFEFNSLLKNFGTYILPMVSIGEPLLEEMAGEDEYGGYYIDSQGNQFGWPEMLESWLDGEGNFYTPTSADDFLTLEEAISLIEG